VLKVWVLLAGAMVVVAAAGRFVMPTEDAPAGGGAVAVAKNFSDIHNIVTLRDPSISPRPWRFIVIHHSATASGSLESITQGHLDRKFDEIGYHFLINNSPAERDGEVTATSRWLSQHAGAHTKMDTHPEFNTEGIGICLVGNFEEKPPTANQMTALTVLVQVLRDQYNIPIDRIAGHRDFTQMTLCPGRLFPMDRFLLDLHTASIKNFAAPPRVSADHP
jgi:N-acetyl-anhydromuramyl-L-alanine amidase AmpD